MHFVSHIGQDRWVAQVLRFKERGYFLDFGTFDGLSHSNTFYLEKYLSWRGICVEPNPAFFAAACLVRSAIMVNSALWHESRLALEMQDAHGLSSLVEFGTKDSNADLRSQITRRVIKVDTINPTELLDRHGVPEQIDYLSLDVEGCEMIVLKALDFQRYRIALLSIEHNHDEEKRGAVREFLGGLGYGVADLYNDDLFFHPEVLAQLTDGAFDDPVAVRDNVRSEYRIRDY